MSTVALNIEKEIEALEPEDAQSKKSNESVMPKLEPYTLPCWDLGVRAGLNLTKLAHFDEDGLDE